MVVVPVTAPTAKMPQPLSSVVVVNARDHLIQRVMCFPLLI
jgi:hypothetical protein